MRHPGRAWTAGLVVVGFLVFLKAWQRAQGVSPAPAVALAVDPTLARDLAAAEGPPHVETPGEKREKRDAARLGMANREAYARLYETRLLDNNMNVDVTTSGEFATTLTLKWALVSKVVAHQMSKDDQMFQTMRLIGFKKFVITDGYRDTWSWDLAR